MLLSRNLLIQLNKKFENVSDEQLTIGLNAIGVEVEQIIKPKVNPGLKVGKLLSAEKHPDSDHLNICQVQVGDEILQIVCGAKWLPIGKNVIVTPVGYKLTDEITIAPRKMRGVVSYGMMAGYSELAPEFKYCENKHDADSIINFDENIEDDQILEFLGLNDTVYDLSIPSNRNELNGAYWLAYELNAYFKFETPYLESNLGLENNAIEIDAEISKEGLKTYSLLEFKLNKPYTSTSWSIKKVLMNSGIHVTNTLADLGNYITLLFANPVHLFDKDLVDKKISVKPLLEDTTLLGLDNKEYLIHKGSIVTSDSNGIIAVVGQMGAKRCAINENTTNVLMEIANLNADYLRANAKLNKISTQSATLFSKPLSVYITSVALSVALNDFYPQFDFISDLALVHKPKPKCQKTISFRVEQVQQILGVKLELQEIKDILALTHFIYDGKDCLVPLYRLDVTNVADICEEIVKSLDVNTIQTQPVECEVLDFKKNWEYEQIQTIRNLLVNQQFIETKTYNLTSKQEANLFNWFNVKENVSILNPLSTQRETLRVNLVHQMLNVLEYNINHKEDLNNIFEIQKIQNGMNDAFNVLVCLVSVDHFKNVMNKNKLSADILTTQAIYNLMANKLGFNLNVKYNVEGFEGLYHQNNFALYNVKNQFVGVVGTLKNQLLNKQYKIKNDVFAIAINLDLTIQSIERKQHIINAISEFNPIYKEFSFTNPNNTELGLVFNEIKKVNYVNDVELYDVFKNENMTSYTISVKIQSMDKTLDSSEIDNTLDQINSILKNNKLEVR